MSSQVSPFLPALCLLVITTSTRCDPEPARVPKVYNALITSSQNLAGSKSFPVYQPFYQEAFPYPFPPAFYYQDHFKDFFEDRNLNPSRPDGKPQQNPSAPQPGSPQLPPGFPGLLPPEDFQRRGGEGDPKTSSTAASDPKVQPPNDSSSQSPPPQPSTESPIPLNEFGLPPSLVPLTPARPGAQPTYSYDPFTRFNPYYPQFDPYLDPFPFQSYPPLPHVYRFDQNVPQQTPEQPPEEVSSEGPQSSPVPPADTGSSTVPPAPSDLDINNYSNKDPSIPDVPPPPVPNGGLKDDLPKEN